MIKNNKQLTIAKENLSGYEKFIEDEIKALETNGAHAVEIELKTNILNAQKEKLRLEIQEYEDLLKSDEIIIRNIYDLPKAIVKARLRNGYSQSELAKKIEVVEQQIQRYEAQDYNKANLERVVQIINALDMEFSMVLKPKAKAKVITLEYAGVNSAHLMERKNALIERRSLMVMGG
ncbi:MAG: helix-turn-helix domain-containing protein [Bacteroidales bacterium]|nr:helix-turn-helix domain-containing protein [Bacteroidales bacterium]